MRNQRIFCGSGPKPRFWFLFPFLFLGMFLAVGFVVMWLWNWIMPDLLGANTLDFPRALGLLALCRILFGSFGKGRNRDGYYRQKMREKWQNMTEEERAKLKGRFDEQPPERGA